MAPVGDKTVRSVAIELGGGLDAVNSCMAVDELGDLRASNGLKMPTMLGVCVDAVAAVVCSCGALGVEGAGPPVALID